MTSASIETRTFRNGLSVALIGVFFCLLGTLGVIGLVFIATRPAEGGIPSTVRIALVAMTALPLAFIVLGGWLSLAGERVTLDPPRREVRIAYGLWWVWEREVVPLTAFEAIGLTREVARVGHGDPHGSAAHVIRLLGAARETELARRGDYHAARRLAESLCTLCDLPLRDMTEAETVEREAGTLQESLGQRARRLGEAAAWPSPLTDNRIETTSEPGLTTLHLPRPDGAMIREGILSLAFLLAIYGGALVALGFFLRSLLAAVQREAWLPLVWGAALLPIVALLLFGCFLLLAREQVAVSHRGLRRTWEIAGLTLRRAYPGDELEDLVCNRDELLLRSDRRTLRIGFALRSGERRWLGRALRHLLTHGPRPPGGPGPRQPG